MGLVLLGFGGFFGLGFLVFISKKFPLFCANSVMPSYVFKGGGNIYIFHHLGHIVPGGV